MHMTGNTCVEAILVDAYSSFILRQAQNQAADLRRETAEYAMSRAARGSRTSLWTRSVVRAARGAQAAHAATAARRRVAPGPSPTVLRAE